MRGERALQRWGALFLWMKGGFSGVGPGVIQGRMEQRGG